MPNFPETIAEMDKNSAEMYLGHPNLNKSPIDEYRRFETRITEIQDKNVFTISTDAKTLEEVPDVQDMRIRLARVILRQKGRNPGEIELKDGKLFVVMDEPDKEPIFHVKRQTRGMSSAKLEEIKNKKEAEQRHKEETQKLQDEKEQIVQETNKKSWNKTSTRSEDVDKDSKRAMFARTAQTTDYGAKAKSFQQSLKVKPNASDQHTRNVVLHSDNNNVKRKSHGMSR